MSMINQTSLTILTTILTTSFHLQSTTVYESQESSAPLDFIPSSLLPTRQQVYLEAHQNEDLHRPFLRLRPERGPGCSRHYPR
jgi:hypothetical protein